MSNAPNPASASLLMKQYKELTDPKKAIPSFHITVSKAAKNKVNQLWLTVVKCCIKHSEQVL